MRGVTCGPVADLSGGFWMLLFQGCHNINKNGVTLRAWPDGGCLLEQEHFIVEAFQIMRGEAMKIMGEQIKGATRGR